MTVNPHTITRRSGLEGMIEWARDYFASAVGLTASSLLQTNASGQIVPLASPTLAEIVHVAGGTSAFQTQIDAIGKPNCWAFLGTSLAADDYRTAQELPLDSTVYDDDSMLASGRVTPNVAGIYLALGAFETSNSWTLASSNSNRIDLRKNGSTAAAGDYVIGVFAHGQRQTSRGNGLVYGMFEMNGTTDYLSMFFTVSTDISIVVTGNSVGVSTYLKVFRVSK